MDATTPTVWSKKDLIGIRDLSRQEIEIILDTAPQFLAVSKRASGIKKVPLLQGRLVVNWFHEPSTRTRTSFELAAKRLSADTLSIAASSSSSVKGETLHDTLANIEAMRADIIVLRHGCAGAPHMLAAAHASHIINAGDGRHEHPTQALLDVFTMRQSLRNQRNDQNLGLDGMKVARHRYQGKSKAGDGILRRHTKKRYDDACRQDTLWKSPDAAGRYGQCNATVCCVYRD